MGYFDPIPGTKGRFASHLELIITGTPAVLLSVKTRLTLHNESIKQQITRLKKTKPRSMKHLESINAQLKELEPQKTVICYAEVEGGLSVPPGCYFMVEKIENPEVMQAPQMDIKWLGIERHYQKTAAEELLKHRRASVQLATGTGKSKLIQVLARTLAAAGKRVLVVVPSIELLKQTFFPLKEDGSFTVTMLGGGESPRLGCNVVVTTMQSALNVADQFDAIITDECFVAGTVIGNTTIENLRPGDLVPSFCEHSRTVKMKKVVSTSRREAPKELVAITTESGKTVICTKNHPFFTKSNKWILAEHLKKGDYAYCYRQSVRDVRESIPQGGLAEREPEREVEPRISEILLKDVRSTKISDTPKRNNAKISEPEETEFLDIERISYVEILEQGCDERFGRVCPDGYVYNFEVEDFHTYFANGIAVHNCQHNSAKTLVNMFSAAVNAEFVYGMSASPWRADGMTQLIWNFAGPIVFKYTGGRAIKEGYLAPLTYVQRAVPMEDKTTKFMQPIKRYIKLHSHENYIYAAEKFVRDALDKKRRVLVLFKSTECCKKLGKRLGVHSADGEFRQPFYAFKKGETDLCIANVSLLGEGIDVPSISAIIYCAGSTSEISVVQAFGRGTRKIEGKKDCVIVDLHPDLPDWKNKARVRQKYFNSHFTDTLDTSETGINFDLDEIETI